MLIVCNVFAATHTGTWLLRTPRSVQLALRRPPPEGLQVVKGIGNTALADIRFS